MSILISILLLLGIISFALILYFSQVQNLIADFPALKLKALANLEYIRLAIEEKHAHATLYFLGDTPEREQVMAQIRANLDEFESLCHGIRVLGELTPRALDVIGGLGERISVPQVTALLARRGWQNSLDPGSGDFLLVTATNMGFNKTNARRQGSRRAPRPRGGDQHD